MSDFCNTLQAAADMIERDAKALKECHQVNGYWQVNGPSDVSAYEDYKEGMILVAKLRKFARVKDVPCQDAAA